ncbi:NAD(P)/FAD-dependent oxidoreductase [Pacificimonas sp. ICDLI1SI03]
MTADARIGDHAVIGGGPAGAMLAAGLARAGGSVALLERSDGPVHKICGEFLSWEACALLRQEGVDLDALGGAAIDCLRIVAGNRSAGTPLPGTALGISRYRLDEALLTHAGRCGASIWRGTHVRALEGDMIRLADGTRLRPNRLWLATGKADVRGAARDPAGQKVTRDLVGFKLHLDLAAADRSDLARTIELHRLPDGYAGLQPIEEGRANLCLLVSEEVAADGWEGVRAYLARVAPALDGRLRRGRALYDQPLAISRVPYGYVDRGAAGPVRVGDQLAVIHSFTGDGMAIAIASGIAAAASAENPEPAARKQLHNMVRKPVGRAAFLYAVLANGGMAFNAVMTVPALARVAAHLTRIA